MIDYSNKLQSKLNEISSSIPQQYIQFGNSPGTAPTESTSSTAPAPAKDMEGTIADNGSGLSDTDSAESLPLSFGRPEALSQGSSDEESMDAFEGGKRTRRHRRKHNKRRKTRNKVKKARKNRKANKTRKQKRTIKHKKIHKKRYTRKQNNKKSQKSRVSRKS